jgi:glucose-1-phosphate thymidylyltransferase
MKGIILAGGKGTRLYPSTLAVSKQLLPLYSKPLLYYPLSLLMMAGIRDILVISTPDDQASFRRLLGDGSQWGVNFQYIVQMEPRGLADAFIIGEHFLSGDGSILVLGDNLFFAYDLQNTILNAVRFNSSATIFACEVKDPERYGIVEVDENLKAISIEEKPKHPKSNLAVPGLYIYDGRAPMFSKQLTPSARGEIEITDLNRLYLEAGDLQVCKLGRGTAWLDAGTNESLLQAANFVAAIEDRQGLMVACPEEICRKQGWINDTQLLKLSEQYKGNSYGQYLERLALK